MEKVDCVPSWDFFALLHHTEKKLGTGMAPPWNNFHVHRIAQFQARWYIGTGNLMHLGAKLIFTLLEQHNQNTLAKYFKTQELLQAEPGLKAEVT